MSIKINPFQKVEAFNWLEAKKNENLIGQPKLDRISSIEVLSANNLYAFEGNLRKLQLLQKFAANNVSNNKSINFASASSAKHLGGNDDEVLKETQRLIDNYRRQIKPNEIKGSQPVAPKKPSGHADAKHKVKPEVQAEIMNNPDRIFSGKRINRDGSERYVDIYYKKGSAVITEQGDKGRVITAYGLIDKRRPNPKPFTLEKITENPNYVEIKLEKLGSTNVIYPNKPRFDANDFPPGPPKTNTPPTTNGSSNTGGTTGGKPNAANPSGQKVPVTNEPVVTPQTPVTNEPPITPKSPTVDENLPKPNPLGKLAKNVSRGLVVMQLVQLGLTALNFSQLKADGEKLGYYVDPFFDKYIITEPDKAAANLPEGFELEFFTDPNDYASIGNSTKFTVKDGKFFNPDGYSLVYNKEKGYVEAVLIA